MVRFVRVAAFSPSVEVLEDLEAEIVLVGSTEGKRAMV